MRFKRMWAMIAARNREFFRDRAAFGWNFLFPFLLIGGFAVIFGGQDYKGFKIGLFPCPTIGVADNSCVPDSDGGHPPRAVPWSRDPGRRAGKAEAS
jgi:ABC-2 type transport system permease protein